MGTAQSAFPSGKFFIGCNYWASHAGTAMWRDWRPGEIERDLECLADAGVQVLRVFPLWPDFQPIHFLRGGGGAPREVRFGEEPLPDADAGRAGVSEEALERFQWFADCAHRHGLRLSVGLITGWMSGRLFVPPALEGRPIHTDPTALMWQVRFVRCFVRRFREHPAIAAWGPGNECNCMGGARTREEAWAWTALITAAIRTEDPVRPIISGMHGLKPLGAGTWTIEDQGELTDMLTTHPYPIFTPRCDLEGIRRIRNGLHATAESCLYADVSGRPCMVEEIGTLGPMFCTEQGAADYIRTVLFSAWAHDLRALLWWCAWDQAHLEHAPYDWDSVERELGLFRADRSPKPVMRALSGFRRFLENLPFDRLPPRRTEAVCLLTRGQDHWPVALSTFILAKQAGFDIRFQTVDQPLQSARFYLMPAISGGAPLSRRRWLELQRRVREQGATLYISCHDGLLAPITDFIGAEFAARERRAGPAGFRFTAGDDSMSFEMPAPVRLDLRVKDADVLAAEEDGTPILIRRGAGRGRVYFMGIAPERILPDLPGAFDRFPCGPVHEIYRFMAAPFAEGRAVRQENPQVGVTEHGLDEHRRVVVAVNYSDSPAETAIEIGPSWRIAATLRGDAPGGRARDGRVSVRIPANDALVLLLEKGCPGKES